MTVVLSRHIFGTVRGYQMLAASADVTDEERRLLESFSFGQTDSRAYLDSLPNEPSYWSRPLPSGRRAITRVLRGAPDDQGRATLLFVTVLLSNDTWVNSLACDDTQLLTNSSIWEWDGAPDLAQLRVKVGKTALPTLNAQEKDRVLSLLGAVERESDHPTTTIVGADGTLVARDIALLVALLPHDYKPQFSYAVRSLSDGLPVHVNGLAECASRGKSRRKVVRWSPDMKSDPREYTAALSYFWRAGTDPPWTFVANCKSFGQVPFDLQVPSPRFDGAAPPAPPDFVKGGPAIAAGKGFPLYALLTIVLVLLMAATAFYVQRTVVAKRESESLLMAVRTFLEANPLPDSLTQDSDERDKLVEEARALAKRLTAREEESGDKGLNTLRDDIGEWQVTAKARCAEYEVLDDLLDGFNAFRKTLGLDSPGAITEYPKTSTITARQEWYKKLKEQETLADALGEPYRNQIGAALSAIDESERRLEHFRQARAEQRGKVQEELATLYEELTELRKSLAAPRPTQLGQDSLEDWENHRARLESLREKHRQLESSDSGEWDHKIQRRMDSCEKLGATWADRINDLNEEFEAVLQEARKIVTDSNLKFDPPVATHLTEPWDEATRALSVLARALTIWPKNDEATQDEAEVKAWLTKAGQSAFKHFESDVDSVQEKWEDWKAEDGSDLTIPKSLLDELNLHLEYWREHRHIIEYGNHPGADELQSRARQLKVYLGEAGTPDKSST